MDNGVDDLRGRFLEWLYEQANGQPNQFIEVEPFLVETGVGIEMGFSLVGDAAARGLVVDASAMGNPCAALTVNGLAAVQLVLRRRADPALRAAAARTGLLRWMYKEEHRGNSYPTTDGVLTTDYAVYAGGRLTHDDVVRAGDYLREKGLISGSGGLGRGGVLRATLTTEGTDCVEQNGGNVTEYLSQYGRGGTVFNIGTVHNSGAAAFGGDATQNVTTAVDPAALAALVESLLRAVRAVPLEDAARSTATEALEEAKQELDKPEPDQGRIAGALHRFAGVITKIGEQALVAVLLGLAQQHGLPTAGA